MAMITCAVPTLNSARTLEATLLSLRSQFPSDVEVVVIDSGSTDRTLDICRTLGVPVLLDEPDNMYRAINKGLSSADSEWLAYLNSDDWVYPGSYARLMELGESTHADIVYGNCDYADASGRFIYPFLSARPRQLRSLFRMGIMGIPQPTAIFRRSTFAQLGGFDATLHFVADADFYSRALDAGKMFAYCDRLPVSCFRVHREQLSFRRRSSMDEECRHLLARREGKPGPMDWWAFLDWKFRNLPNYLIRIIRASYFSKRIRMPRSMDDYDE
jgi:glycosyltransferase involved in cell wall biosynthesis